MQAGVTYRCCGKANELRHSWSEFKMNFRFMLQMIPLTTIFLSLRAQEVKVYLLKNRLLSLKFGWGQWRNPANYNAHRSMCDTINDYVNACTLFICFKDYHNLMEFFIIFVFSCRKRLVDVRDWLLCMKFSISICYLLLSRFLITIINYYNETC